MSNFLSRLFGKKKAKAPAPKLTNLERDKLEREKIRKELRKKQKKGVTLTANEETLLGPDQPVLGPWTPDSHYQLFTDTPMPEFRQNQPVAAPFQSLAPMAPQAQETGGSVIPENLPYYKSALLRAVNASNHDFDNGIASVKDHLAGRYSNTAVGQGSKFYAGNAFDGIFDLYNSYARQITYNMPQNQVNAAMQLRTNPATGKNEIADPTYLYRGGQDMYKMFFDYIETNKAAREYLWTTSDNTRRAEVFGGDRRKAFEFMLQDTFLRNNLSAGTKLSPELKAMQDHGGTGKLLLESNKITNRMMNLLGTEAGHKLYENGDDGYKALHGYLNDRINNLAEMMGI